MAKAIRESMIAMRGVMKYQIIGSLSALFLLIEKPSAVWLQGDHNTQLDAFAVLAPCGLSSSSPQRPFIQPVFFHLFSQLTVGVLMIGGNKPLPYPVSPYKQMFPLAPSPKEPLAYELCAFVDV